MNNIVVADDEKLCIEVIKLCLKSIGITENVSYCNDGKSALYLALRITNEALKNYNGKKL